MFHYTMKRGKKNTVVLTISLSLIILLSLSLVSASFLGDLFNTFFRETGLSIDRGGGDGCYDADGPQNFEESSWVSYDDPATYEQDYVYDNCLGEVAYDYKCVYSGEEENQSGGGDQAPPGVPTEVFIDIFGSEYTLGYDSIDCSTLNVGCNAGVCGCTPGDTRNCGPETSDGICEIGTQTCGQNRQWDTCDGAVWPEQQETCNGLDDDCDGKVDNDENICPINQICDPFLKRCVAGAQGGCNDEDGDGYGNPGSSACFNDQTDCNDNDATINPGATEVCGNNVDDDCDGSIDEGCQVDESCTDEDNDGYAIEGDSCGQVDCDDNDPNINPGEEELCDGVDNDCNSQTTEEDLGILCGETSLGICTQQILHCTDGIWESNADCNSAGIVTPTDTDACGDAVDNDCDGSIDEGCVCVTGDTRECTPEDVCKLGEQTCTNNQWGACEETEDITNCNAEEDCQQVGAVETCGTNLGICIPGLKTCGENSKWGACTGGVRKNTNEICNNNLDDDCDGSTDETNCVNIAVSTPSLSSASGITSGSSGPSDSADTASGGAQGSGMLSPGSSESELGGAAQGQQGSQSAQSPQNLGFFGTIWRFISAFFNLGRSLVGFSIAEEPLRPVCTDSDLGINYFLKGSGNGPSSGGVEIYFSDFCYTGSQANKVDKCGGEECFLKEYYCEDEHVKSEAKVICQYGCTNGACVPDASLNEDCQKFDKDLWKWVNVC